MIKTVSLENNLSRLKLGWDKDSCFCVFIFNKSFVCLYNGLLSCCYYKITYILFVVSVKLLQSGLYNCLLFYIYIVRKFYLQKTLLIFALLSGVISNRYSVRTSLLLSSRCGISTKISKL